MKTNNVAGFADYALLIGLAALWGSSFIFTKIALEEIPPATQTAYRLALSMLLLWVIFAAGRHPMVRDGKTLGLIFLSGLFGIALPFLLISWGQTVVPPGLTAIFMAVMPLMTLLVAHMLTKDEKFTMRKTIGIVIGMIGIVILVGPTLLSSLGSELMHQLAILAAACCYAVNAVITKFLLKVPRVSMVTLSFTFAVIPVVVLAYFFDGGFSFDYSGKTLGSVISLAIFHTTLASFLLIYIIQRQGATFFGQINLLVPLFGVLWAFLIFSERPSINAGLALILILAGILVARGRAKTE